MELSLSFFDRAGWHHEDEVVTGERKGKPDLLALWPSSMWPGHLPGLHEGSSQGDLPYILLLKETSGKGRANLFPHLPPLIPRIRQNQ